MTLTEFLLARIAEDEAIWGGMPERVPTTDLVIAAGEWPDGESAILLTTNRHAAECAAKRAIVKDEQGYITLNSPDTITLRYLALPYADHPDYLPEWKPVTGSSPAP